MDDNIIATSENVDVPKVMKEKVVKEKVPKVPKVPKEKVVKEKVVKEKVVKEKVVKEKVVKEKVVKEKVPKVPKEKVVKEKVPKIPKEKVMKENKWYCYLLRNNSEPYLNCTYNGSTNNPMKRLRQHNEEIKGGAKATHGKNGAWEIYALLSGFKDHKNTLQCEWKIKCPSGKPGKRAPKHNGVINRIKSLNEVLILERWTKQSTVNNCDCPYHLVVTDDVVQYLDRSVIPGNITIVSVPSITAEHI